MYVIPSFLISQMTNLLYNRAQQKHFVVPSITPSTRILVIQTPQFSNVNVK